MEMEDLLAIPPVTSTQTALLPTATVIPDLPEFQHITKFGHNVLWVVFALMLLSSIAFTLLTWRVTVQKRIFHQITTYITIIATISYFAMAVGSGSTWHRSWEKHGHKHDIPDTHKTVIRQIFFARYIDWLLTTPLLLIDLGLLAGLNGSNLINVIVADVIMIVTGWFAAAGHNRKQTWGWYIISCIAFVSIIYNLAISARATAQRRGVQKLFVPLAAYTIIIWTLYPIVWAISEGANRLSPNSEVLAYAILDVLAKPVFGFWLLVAHQRLPASNVHLGGVWSEGFGHQEGTLRVGDDDEA